MVRAQKKIKGKDEIVNHWKFSERGCMTVKKKWGVRSGGVACKRLLKERIL